LQHPEHHDAIERELIAPLVAAHAAARREAARKAAATKVDFFTMVRGED
ncbi:MAG: phosphonate C-P lyase system protein PhnG, partial [Azoarcus sp.]|nr:phosphonate C-P lyase system protein PhnG [Azoarcus sp.]